MAVAAPPNVALQNLFTGLVREWETARGRRLEEHALDSEFGGDAAAIRDLLAGHVPAEDPRSSILCAVQRLGGDDEDASSALVLALTSPDATRSEEAVVMNDRLLTRLQNLERFIRRIGKLDEFHDWVADGAGR